MQIRTGQMAVLLLIVFAMSGPAVAQDIDAKIKRLEDLEARIDAKLRRLESLEARLESRLEMGIQPVAAQAQIPVSSIGNGGGAASIVMGSAVAAGAAAPRGNGLWGGQVSFRGGYTHLDSRTRGAVFSGGQTGTDGFLAGGALDVPLMPDPMMGEPILGQISVDYTGIQGKTNFAVTGTGGNQSLLKIAISPKWRIDSWGKIRPWIIPIGISFLVNSPPSESVAYLTVGGTTGAGAEYLTWNNRLALGFQLSYNFYDRGSNRINTNHFSVGPYLGINF